MGLKGRAQTTRPQPLLQLETWRLGEVRGTCPRSQPTSEGSGVKSGLLERGLETWHFWVFAHLSKTVPSPAWLLRLCKIGCVPGSCILLLWFQTPGRHHPQCPEDSHGLYLPSRKCRRNLLLVQLFRYFKSHIFNSVLCQVYHDGLKLK